PFADLKLPEKKEELARGWRLDIFRNRQERDNEDMEDSAWSPTEDHSSHVPSMFGFMFLEAFGGKCPPPPKEEKKEK
ncbi:MAG: hypothetical protein V1809_03030, partial [Planctomycetota bacterium]